MRPVKYLIIAAVRPFTFFVAILPYLTIGAKSFGDVGSFGIVAILLMTTSAVISFATVYGVGKLIGKKLVNPWLSSNLPQTFKFVRSQDWKIVILTRLIPFIPFDILSFFYGILDFRFKQTLIFTTLIAVAESYLLFGIIDEETSVTMAIFSSMAIISGVFIVPGIIYEWIMRKRGSGLIRRVNAMGNELIYEMRLNNDIVKRHSYSKSSSPVLLLYGFFSSRRTLSVMERLLTQRGYQVISFNLGGLFDIFFTRGIIETAKFIDYKLMRQFNRNEFKKVRIVAHSKGGLVALWWVLRLGGYRYCDRVVTMGTPFKGSRLTWLALITPLGFWWKDVWQMRPGSSTLKALEDTTLPPNVKITCLYSDKDRVATGRNGVYSPYFGDGNQVEGIPMHHVSHFEFLYRRDVADQLALSLGDPESVDTSARHPKTS